MPFAPHHTQLKSHSHTNYTHRERLRESEKKRDVRNTKHDRSAVLLGNEASNLPPGLVDGHLVLFAHDRVALPHGQMSCKTVIPIEKYKIEIPNKPIIENPTLNRLDRS